MHLLLRTPGGVYVEIRSPTLFSDNYGMTEKHGFNNTFDPRWIALVRCTLSLPNSEVGRFPFCPVNV
jgi:hypothetical protein